MTIDKDKITINIIFYICFEMHVILQNSLQNNVENSKNVLLGVLNPSKIKKIKQN